MTPQGALTKVMITLRQLGKKGDRADLDAYMASEALAMLKQLIPAKSIPTVGAAYDKALEHIEQRHRPLAPGKHRAHWTADMVARLKASWARHGNPYRVAKELQITERAAIAAHHRFVVQGTPPREALGEPRGAPAKPEAPFPAPAEAPPGRAA